MSRNADNLSPNCTQAGDIITWCDELNQLRGNVSQLQATLNQILNKAPSISEYREAVQKFDEDVAKLGLPSPVSSSNNNNNLSQFKTSSNSTSPATNPAVLERTRSILNSSQLKIAVRLKYLYSRGYLPLLLALANINFRSLKQDRFVGYFLNYIPPRVVKRDIPDALRKVIISENKLGQNDGGISLSPEDENYPPLIPLISDKTILDRVLIDKSYVEPQAYLELILSQLQSGTAANGPEWSRPTNNLKLALLGQLILETCLYEIIDHQYPSYDETDVENLVRYHLTSPLMVLKFVIGYNLASHLNYLMSRLDTVDDKLRVFHRLFCAYIGGLRKDGYTYKDLLVWLRRLYLPLVASTGYSPMNHAKADLEFLFKQANNIYAGPIGGVVSITYDIEERGELGVLEATVKVDGESIGVGTHSSDPEQAKERAAAYALGENRDLVILKVALMLQRGAQLQKDQSNDQNAITTTNDTTTAAATATATIESEQLQSEINSVESNDEDEDYSPIMSPNGSMTSLKGDDNVEINGEEEDDDYDPEAGLTEPSSLNNEQDDSTKEEPRPTQPQTEARDSGISPLPYGMVTGFGAPQSEGSNGISPLQNTFESLLASHQLQPRYVTNQLKKGHRASVFVGDVEMGQGRGKSKEEAIDMALSNSLRNGTAWRHLGF
ncbi:uncharacterized protein KQ657_002910 [Scheffersomyces spartinae]|uniref:Uncharacterized protein n=1 Tax=Scheffersomyces spartinae TaxID=45513 RepID=A0A9P7V5Q2_9ASCO|nr:uncharacterized protein KQ657_002910 [Scheffersomyces spartinae]KAG7191641.1 hypothetical protein KQ657_002910 [Scheffersomyces spartinae]